VVLFAAAASVATADAAATLPEELVTAPALLGIGVFET
jgi:hypothetical protein